MPFLNVFLKSDCETSAELLFANRIGISGKRVSIPVMCELFHFQSLQHVEEKTHVVSLLEKPPLMFETS